MIWTSVGFRWGMRRFFRREAVEIPLLALYLGSQGLCQRPHRKPRNRPSGLVRWLRATRPAYLAGKITRHRLTWLALFLALWSVKCSNHIVSDLMQSPNG